MVKMTFDYLDFTLPWSSYLFMCKSNKSKAYRTEQNSERQTRRVLLWGTGEKKSRSDGFNEFCEHDLQYEGIIKDIEYLSGSHNLIFSPCKEHDQPGRVTGERQYGSLRCKKWLVGFTKKKWVNLLVLKWLVDYTLKKVSLKKIKIWVNFYFSMVMHFQLKRNIE